MNTISHSANIGIMTKQVKEHQLAKGNNHQQCEGIATNNTNQPTMQ